MPRTGRKVPSAHRENFVLPTFASSFLSLSLSFSLPLLNPHSIPFLSTSPCSLRASPSTSSRSGPSPPLPARYPSLPHRPYFDLVPANHLQASKVAVLGAGGGIGQPLSLLMKLNPRVTDLALYDIKGGPGTIMPIVRSADGY